MFAFGFVTGMLVSMVTVLIVAFFYNSKDN